MTSGKSMDIVSSARVKKLLVALIETQFGGKQTTAAKALGVSQSHISGVISGRTGPGMNLLVALRDWTGLSIDALLDLPPPKRPQ